MVLAAYNNVVDTIKTNIDIEVKKLPCSTVLWISGPAPIHKRISPKKWVSAEPGSLIFIDIVPGSTPNLVFSLYFEFIIIPPWCSFKNYI